jgi:hypothetical protein
MSADTESLLEMTSTCDQEVSSLRASQILCVNSKSPGFSEEFAEGGVVQSFASAWASNAVSVKPRNR